MEMENIYSNVGSDYCNRPAEDLDRDEEMYVNAEMIHVKLSNSKSRAPKSRRSRRLVLITVLLGLMCVLLVIALIVLYIHLTAERDLMNMSYMKIAQKYSEDLKSLKMNYSHVTDERDQLQKNLQSINQIKLKFETEMKKMNSQKGSGWYYISSDKKSWSDSRQFCRDRGGDLIIINTEEEQGLISSIIKEGTWIGLSDKENEGIMKWVDDTLLNKAFWNKDEPNNVDDEDCIEMMPLSETKNNWNDLKCTAQKKWICEN